MVEIHLVSNVHVPIWLLYTIVKLCYAVNLLGVTHLSRGERPILLPVPRGISVEIPAHLHILSARLIRTTAPFMPKGCSGQLSLGCTLLAKL